MPSALDAAQHIIDLRGPMTTMKLQKLVYYGQVWSVVWDDDVLFEEPIQAWDNGPVVRELWEATRGQFRIRGIPDGDASKVGESARATIERMLKTYGDKDAQWLSDLTHMEAPWKEAYARGQNSVISLECISEYYSSLRPDE